MSQVNTSVKEVQEGKFTFVYINDVVVYYAKVHEAKLKYKSQTEKEFGLNAFITEAAKEQMEDLRINKEFALVGKDKKKKGDRGIKFPLSNQTEGSSFDEVKGLYGFSIGADQMTKAGKERFIKVVNTSGKAIKDLVGNGSICDIKCLAYRTQDGDMNLILDTVRVKTLVAFEAKSDVDSEWGITIESPVTEETVEEAQEDIKEVKKAPKKAPEPVVGDEDDDSLPF